jgi:hypothetical protein
MDCIVRDFLANNAPLDRIVRGLENSAEGVGWLQTRACPEGFLDSVNFHPSIL